MVPFEFYKCDVCTYGTKLSSTLNTHLKKHVKKTENFFECQSSHILEPYKCEDCDFMTDIKTIFLDQHIKSDHKQKKLENPFRSLRCTNCHFTTYSVLVFLGHFCKPNCTQGEHKQQEGRNEAKEMEQNVNKQFKCDLCSESYTKRISLNQHQILMHKSPDKVTWYECFQCPYKTRAQKDFVRHVNGKHVKLEGNARFQCEQCPALFKRKQYLSRHVNRRHSKNNEIQQYQCEQCPFTSEERSCLTRHVTMKHRSSEDCQWFKCEHCSAQYRARSSFRRHVAMNHNNMGGIIWYQCDRCPFKSQWKTRLDTHVYCKHTKPEEINWFECGKCSLKFKLKSSLGRHWLRLRHGLAEASSKSNRKRVRVN